MRTPPPGTIGRASQVLSAGPRRGDGRSGVGGIGSSPGTGSSLTEGSRRRILSITARSAGATRGGRPAGRSAERLDRPLGGGRDVHVRPHGGQAGPEALALTAEDEDGLLALEGAAEPAAGRLGRHVLGTDVLPALPGDLVDRVGKGDREELLGRTARP